MEILMKIPDDLVEPGMTREHIAMRLHAHVSDVYDTTFEDSTMFLRTPDDPCDKSCRLILGTESPKTVITRAKCWNPILNARWASALAEWKKEAVYVPGKGKDWLKANAVLIYQAKKALMALDNDLAYNADFAVLVNDYDYFTCTLTDEELDAVVAHPEQYAILTVWPNQD